MEKPKPNEAAGAVGGTYVSKGELGKTILSNERTPALRP